MLEQALIYKGNFDFKTRLRSYGVTVRIESNTRELLDDAQQVARKALANQIEIIDSEAEEPAEHAFGLALDQDGTFFLFKNGEPLTHGDSKYVFMKFFNSMLRIGVAENASSHVFVHAGVVERNGLAIIFPGKSYQGKTTLVAELVRRGAVYYSDEYAVLNDDGLVEAFPRDLSVRYFDEIIREKDVPVSSFGGRSGIEPIPVGLVVLTEFQENAEWNPQIISAGQGIMEIISHTLPIRVNTDFVLKTLNKALSRAIIAKSPRGDASKAAEVILSYFDNHINAIGIS